MNRTCGCSIISLMGPFLGLRLTGYLIVTKLLFYSFNNVTNTTGVAAGHVYSSRAPDVYLFFCLLWELILQALLFLFLFLFPLYAILFFFGQVLFPLYAILFYSINCVIRSPFFPVSRLRRLYFFLSLNYSSIHFFSCFDIFTDIQP